MVTQSTHLLKDCFPQTGIGPIAHCPQLVLTNQYLIQLICQYLQSVTKIMGKTAILTIFSFPPF